MDSHVAYQTVPIDLNEFNATSGQSLLPTTFGGNRNNPDDADNHKKLYVSGGLVVAWVLLFAIVLPTVHHHHKQGHIHTFTTDMPHTVGTGQQSEPRLLLNPSVENQTINQEEHSSNKNYVLPINVDKVITNDDETIFGRDDYLGNDEGVFDLVDYIRNEEGGINAELGHEHPSNGMVDGQDGYLEDENDDNEMFPEDYGVLVSPNEDEFEAFDDVSAFGINGDADSKPFEGESDERHARL
jgi:hypothetical protein